MTTRRIETCKRHIAAPAGREKGHRYGKHGYCLGRYSQAEGQVCDFYGDLPGGWPTDPIPILDLNVTIQSLTTEATRLRATADALDRLAAVLTGPIGV